MGRGLTSTSPCRVPHLAPQKLEPLSVHLQKYTLILGGGREGLWNEDAAVDGGRGCPMIRLVYYQEKSGPSKNDLNVLG